MVSSSPSPPGCSWSWKRVKSAVQRGNDHIPGMGLSVDSASLEEDRLVWMKPKPSRKSMWRLRKERQQNSVAEDRAMDVAPPPVAEEPPARDWSLLPLDVVTLVFVRLSAVDVLMSAGLVCRSWLDAAKVPDVWRVVQMEIGVKMYSKEFTEITDKLHAMAKEAVDRSDGQLRLFAGMLFVTEDLIKYIVERSPLLTTLRLVSCYSDLFSERVTDVIRESPLSEFCSLELERVDVTVDELTTVLENCPVLEYLTVRDCNGMYEEDEYALRVKFPQIKNQTFEFYEFKCCSSCGY
ncbi:unnamed protein product [Alopecurus aequalis]